MKSKTRRSAAATNRRAFFLNKRSMEKKKRQSKQPDQQNQLGTDEVPIGGLSLEDLQLSDIGMELQDIDASLFDVQDGEEKYSEETRYLKPKIYKKPKGFFAYDNAVKLAKDLRLDPGERAEVIVNGSFIFGDFIEAYLLRHQAIAKKMVISTLSLNENNIDSLHNLIKHGWIEHLDLVVSHYFYSMERWKLIPYLYRQLDIDNKFQLAVAFTHTKTVHFETRGGRKIVMHGSANLRSSGNVEQFTIEENADLYDFYDEAFSKIIERYHTVKNAPNRSDMWREIVKQKFND